VAAKAADGHRGKRKSQPKQGDKPRKRIEDAAQYAVSHAIRVETLILLNEAEYTAAELAELIGMPLSTVANHVRRMYEDGMIEIAKEEKRRATMLYWYRAVKLPEYTQEQAEQLTYMERQVTAGLVVTTGTAETIAALRKGYLADSSTILSWDWYQVDSQGKEELETANAAHLEHVREIECRSVNRCAKTMEETTSIVVKLFAYKRARKPRRPRSQKCEPNPKPV
jgi:DNA-binding transcriptional ArsR family regulator